MAFEVMERCEIDGRQDSEFFIGCTIPQADHNAVCTMKAAETGCICLQKYLLPGLWSICNNFVTSESCLSLLCCLKP